MTQKRYTSGSCPFSSPDVSYSYDGSGCPSGLTCHNIGQRTGMTDAAGSEAWSYYYASGTGDGITDQRTTNGVSKTFTYVNNYDKTLASISYPSGRTINYGVNIAEQTTSAVDTANSINYATSAIYYAFGQLSSLSNGTYLLSSFYYNSRLQPCRIAVNSSGSAPNACTDSTNKGNVLDLAYDFHHASGDNGDVFGITNKITSARNLTYTYDALNRIKSAYTGATSGSYCWGEKFNIDQWGNLTGIGDLTSPDPSHTGDGCSRENLSMSPTAQNRLDTGTTPNFVYDSAGNMTNDTLRTLSYDSENRLSSLSGVTYLYDGDGKRVAKSISGTPYKIYWFGMNSDPLTESDGSGGITDEYIFFNGKRIARRSN
jgi:hypothetical protein